MRRGLLARGGFALDAGVDAVLCLSQNRAFELAASGRAAFERSLFVRQLTDAVMTFTVLVDSAGMLEGRRIRVSLGEHHSFTAVMKDDAFNSRIVAATSLVVDLRVVQHMARATRSSSSARSSRCASTVQTTDFSRGPMKKTAVALLCALAASPLVCVVTVEADLVVVGCGHAGLAAALQATE